MVKRVFGFRIFNRSPETNKNSCPSHGTCSGSSHTHSLYQEQTHAWRLYPLSKQVSSFCLSFKPLQEINVAIPTNIGCVSGNTCPLCHAHQVFARQTALLIIHHTLYRYLWVEEPRYHALGHNFTRSPL